MTTLAQDLGGVVRLLEDMTPGDLIVYDANEGDGWPPRPLWCFKNEAYDSGEEPALQGGIHYGGKEDADAIAAAVNFLRTHSAEIAGALRDAERWRPIESAPRDGTRIILGRPHEDGDGGGISVCGYWIDELEDGVDYMGNDGGFTDVDYQVFQPGRSFGAESYRYAGRQPTHWRPLPPAPRAAIGAVGATTQEQA